ncbi:MxaL protein (plasmid) [Caballeronia sp. NK8]|uniref:MxaL protein n=1 Tax=Caballeronia sp. NK8 TaxID=140098 RepID=UPI001BB4F162|nr:MxaL protein [Caballeronia sp. NK8]BCQ27168.1 MxaL protein [Caballeronia sp. NK8]
MRRGAVHLAFGAAALCFAAMAAYDWAMLRHAQAVAAALNAVTANGPAAQQRDDAPEVRLARAVSLAKAGRPNEAQRLFDALVTQPDDHAIQAAALFDLGNMHLREAAGADGAGPIRSLPLLEQAKERYRAALRLMPDDWDARYNLERALWLAPETPGDQEDAEVKKRSTVKLRGAQSDDLP